MGAPLGNQNGVRGKVWRSAINRALEARSRLDQKRNLDALAETLLDLCEQGDLAALRELGDRLDGKPTQAIAGDPDMPPVLHEAVVRFVKADAS